MKMEHNGHAAVMLLPLLITATPLFDISTTQCLLNVSNAVYYDKATATPMLTALGLQRNFFAISNVSQDTHAFVIPVPSANRVILAFRGTDLSISDLEHDLWFLRGPFGSRLGYGNTTVPDSWYVSRGFMNAYLSIRPGVINALTAAALQLEAISADNDRPSTPPTLLVSGHSLGAAMAVIGAMDALLNRNTCDLFGEVRFAGFASPRVGNAEFAAGWTERFAGRALQFMNYYDLIPHEPPQDTGYEHVLHMGVLGPDPGNFTDTTEPDFDQHLSVDPVFYHHVTTYMAHVGSLPGARAWSAVSCADISA